MAENNGEVRVGPWGGKDGTPSDSPIQDGERIAGFKICANSKYVYDLTWIKGPSDVGELSGDCVKVPFEEDEYITGFSGTYNVQQGSTYVTSLSFKTNKGTHGPYGNKSGTDFSLPEFEGKFVGYFKWKLDGFSGFGAILKPK